MTTQQIKTPLAALLTIILLATPHSLARKKKPPQIQNLTGRVTSCHDGDTCRVLVDKKEIKVRFAGIDTPEITQPEGKMARDFTLSLINEKEVKLICEGKSFDRTTCTVFLHEKNINEEIVKSGYAWDTPKYSGGKYRDLMESAQNQKLGIWKTTNTSPYCYRHKTSSKCKTSKMYME